MTDEQQTRSRTIHIFCQGKGGAGKSFGALLAMMYFREHGMGVIGYDLDPINHTLASFKTLKAREFAILAEEDPPVIDRRRFDDLLVELSKLDTDIILDTGSTSFMAMNSYLVDYEVLGELKRQNMNTVMHVVLRGGSSTWDCLDNLEGIISSYTKDECDIVVWKNEVEGKIMAGGKEFEEMKIYKDHHERFSYIVRIPELRDDLMMEDLRTMLASNQTFDDMINSEDTFFMTRLRLRKTKERYLGYVEPVFKDQNATRAELVQVAG